jgi:hypothetical protein
MPALLTRPRTQLSKAPSDVLDERRDLGEGGQIGDRDLATADARGGGRGRGPLAAAAVHDHPRASLEQPPGQLLPIPAVAPVTSTVPSMRPSFTE